MIRGKNRRYKDQSLRRKGLQPQLHTPAMITDFADGSATTAVTFDTAVILHGFPAWTDLSTPTITVTSAVQTSPTEVELTWNAAPTVAITIPFQDPAIRNMGGGFVPAGTFTF